MSASLSVACKSDKTRRQLTEFLRGHLRPFGVVCDDPRHTELRRQFNANQRPPLPTADPDRYDPTRHIGVGHQLSYGRGASKIGFNFNVGGYFDAYMRAVLSWAALQVGRKRGLNDLAVVGHADQRIAYISYDSHTIPVLTEEDVDDWDDVAKEHARQHWQVSWLGLRANENARAYMAAPPVAKVLRTIVEAEMEWLDVLWKQKENC